MGNVAIIAGAGWKCGGAGVEIPPKTEAISLPLAGCPEMLLPLGNGTTVISRLASQLKERGFTLFIGVGACGCTYPSAVHFITYKKRKHKIAKQNAQFGVSGKVWTPERVSYVSRFGITFFGPKPDGANMHSTLLTGIDVAGPNWNRWLLFPGDLIVSDALLDDIMAWPCSCAMWISDQIFWLDAGGVGRYRNLVQAHVGGRSQHHAMSEKAWLRYPARYKDAYIKHDIKFLRYEEIGLHGNEAAEIDYSPHYYPNALEWVKQYG